MADTKISALTALTDVAPDDLFVVVDDPAGTPATKKVAAVDMGVRLYKVLDATATGSNSNSAQPWFPTNGGVTVESGAMYWFRGQLRLTRSAGTTSHTTDLLFGGTATITSIGYMLGAKEGDAATISDWDWRWGTVATALNVKAASTSATENAVFRVEGFVKINAGGTFIPQFKYSAAPGGAPTIDLGTYFELRKLTATSRGTWS